MISLLATTPSMSTVIYFTGLDPIPTTNVAPTNPIEKFQASYPSMYMADKTEFCHGTQIKKGLFSDTKYDMYVIRTRVSDLADDGVMYDFDVYSQFNDNVITVTLSWNTTGGGMDQQDRAIKAIYEGICQQSVAVIRTKGEQAAINAADPTRKPVDPGKCQPEARHLAGVNSRIAMAKIDAYLDPTKQTTFSGSGPLRRIEVATQNVEVQSQHNVVMQALLAEEAAARTTYTLCKNPPKAQVPTVDPLDQLRKLKGLLDDKIISQEEFDTKKAVLLNWTVPSFPLLFTPPSGPHQGRVMFAVFGHDFREVGGQSGNR
ncbi:MAG: SHOCT domain-containing protein [Moraxellaceae bacterium]|nr:SHOCT domain-containing protein [Moraxellaceae bacterium]